jgi:hypothetical protein
VKTGLSRNEIPVDLISVDEFVQERALSVDCIKIDVEGAELSVLKGARNTLKEQRCVTRLGLHPTFITQNGDSLEGIWDLVADLKMRMSFDGDDVTREWFCSQTDLFDVNLLPS